MLKPSFEPRSNIARLIKKAAPSSPVRRSTHHMWHYSNHLMANWELIVRPGFVQVRAVAELYEQPKTKSLPVLEASHSIQYCSL